MRNPEIIGMGVGVMDDDPSRVALVIYVDSTDRCSHASPRRSMGAR